MEHPASECMDSWVEKTFYPGFLLTLPYSTKWINVHRSWAWELMQKVWEMDPYATIHKDRIETNNLSGADDPVKFIAGETFPLRICRAALWLDYTRKK